MYIWIDASHQTILKNTDCVYFLSNAWYYIKFCVKETRKYVLTLFCYFYIVWYLLANCSNHLVFFVVLCDLWLWTSTKGCVLQTERCWSGGWRNVWSIHTTLLSEAMLASGLHTVPVGGRRVARCEYWQVTFPRHCTKACVYSFRRCTFSVRHHVRKRRHIGKWGALMLKIFKWMEVFVILQPGLCQSRSAGILPASILW